MTAHSTIAFLRRHAPPAHVLDCLDAAPSASRPRLSWFLGESGRPVCRWTLFPDPVPPEAADAG